MSSASGRRVQGVSVVAAAAGVLGVMLEEKKMVDPSRCVTTSKVWAIGPSHTTGGKNVMRFGAAVLSLVVSSYWLASGQHCSRRSRRQIRKITKKCEMLVLRNQGQGVSWTQRCLCHTLTVCHNQA